MEVLWVRDRAGSCARTDFPLVLNSEGSLPGSFLQKSAGNIVENILLADVVEVQESSVGSYIYS